MKSYHAFLLTVLVCGGCGGGRTASDLDDLAKTLGCSLPTDTRLLAGQATADTAYWFVRCASQLPLTQSAVGAAPPRAREAIPPGVLAGLLAQHDQTDAASSAADVPGELREWRTNDGTLRIREFHAPDAWYSVIEFARTPGD